jgi:predicted RNA-binding Zn-ribbon protein involved in translation (DUF1610 family)
MAKTEKTPDKTDKRLAAVCGLFCPSCTIFIGTREDPQRLEMLAQMSNLTVEDMRCYGCHAEKRLISCEMCKMVQCATEKGIDFCIECEEYPCEDLKKFQTEYPHRIELWQSQERIKEVGYEKWFEEMIAHYSCPQCGTINSAYDIACRQCGAKPGCGYVGVHMQEIIAYLSKQGMSGD